MANIEVKSVGTNDDLPELQEDPKFLTLLVIYNLIDKVMLCSLRDVPKENLDDLIRRLNHKND
jgi:hypothetical protein